MRRQGLQSSTEWAKSCKAGKHPDDIPVNPPLVYKDKWHSWADWLGTDHVRGARRPFEEAKEYVRGLGLKNSMEWYEWCKVRKRPRDIPAAPDVAYKKEWRGWRDWLGGGGFW